MKTSSNLYNPFNKNQTLEKTNSLHENDDIKSKKAKSKKLENQIGMFDLLT